MSKTMEERIADHQLWLNGQGGCKMTESGYLDGHVFKNVNLSNADFSWAGLERVQFYNCNLKGTNFSMSNLQRATFTGSNLTLANFHRADLRGADLHENIIDKTAFFHCLPTDCGRSGYTLNGLKWSVWTDKETLAIGCNIFSVSWWFESDERVHNLHPAAEKFWQVNKPLIAALCGVKL